MFVGLVCRFEKWRVAQRHIEILIGLYHACKHLARIALQAQRGACQGRIGVYEFLGMRKRGGIDVAAHHLPAQGAGGDDGVYQIGARANVEHAHGLVLTIYRPLGEQIGDVMHTIGAPRYWRAQKALRHRPGFHAIKMLEQGLIQTHHRFGIAEVYAGVASGRGDEKRL